MNLTCDTNVFFNVAAGRIDLSEYKSKGHRICASPVVIIELSSNLTEESFVDKRNAARALLDTVDEILLDPERHFGQIWHLDVPALTIDWWDTVKAMAEARDFDQLKRGVPDISDMVLRRTNVNMTNRLRETHWTGFRESIEQLIDGFHPGYKAARDSGKIRLLGKEIAKHLNALTSSDVFRDVIVLATRDRAAIHLDTVPDEPSKEDLAHAREQLTPYALAYGRYVFGAAAKFGPQDNDWGDLESFSYLQGDFRLLTFEKRWRRIAEEVGVQLGGRNLLAE